MRLLPLVLLLVLACKRGEPKGETAAGAQRVAQLDVFDGPESATYDSVHDVWWVGNTVGDPEKKDGNGFISRVRPDGTVDSLHFVQVVSRLTVVRSPKRTAAPMVALVG